MSAIRYSRQTTLPGWGETGQKSLADATVFIVGLGGLGVPAATYLATAGVGHLVLNDFDTVDASNLARQPLYTESDVGQLKVVIAAAALSRLNPDCKLTIVDQRLDENALYETISRCDIVLDASDNFATRFAVNNACVKTATALVSGAAIRFEAQLAVFRADLSTGPCYRCLYDDQNEDLEDCRGQGVISPLVGVIGSAMALEALRIIVGVGEPFHSRVLAYDSSRADWRSIRLQQDPACPVCS